MTEEKIKKGVELLERLKKLNEEKKLWEKGCTLQSLRISDKYDHIDRDSVYSARVTFINFDKLQSDTLANINEMIVKVQEEFNKL